MSNEEMSPLLRKAAEIIQSANGDNGWVSEEEHNRICAELSKIGIMVVTENANDEEEAPTTDEPDRTFFEVTIHPFVEQYADEDGEEVEGDWTNASGGEYSDEFGDDLDGYPDEMFRKGWSVTSWAFYNGDRGNFGDVDDEEFPDYDSAIAYAEELAARYRVKVDHYY